MNRPLSNLIPPLMLASLLMAPLPASAELVPVEKSAEANHVSVLFTKGTEEGMVQVRDCQGCPLNLGIGDNTRFFLNGKEIERKKTNSLSGKPATVIYSMDGKQALRIRW